MIKSVERSQDSHHVSHHCGIGCYQFGHAMAIASHNKRQMSPNTPSGTTAPGSASSTGQEYLPIDFKCQPVVTPDGVITLYGTMGNPNPKDLTNAKFCLTNVQNATWLDSDLVPTQNANGVVEWDLGILPANRQFNVSFRLQASGKDAVAAVVTGKSDLSATYLAPIAVAIPSDKR